MRSRAILKRVHTFWKIWMSQKGAFNADSFSAYEGEEKVDLLSYFNVTWMSQSFEVCKDSHTISWVVLENKANNFSLFQFIYGNIPELSCLHKFIFIAVVQITARHFTSQTNWNNYEHFSDVYDSKGQPFLICLHKSCSLKYGKLKWISRHSSAAALGKRKLVNCAYKIDIKFFMVKVTHS